MTDNNSKKVKKTTKPRRLRAPWSNFGHRCGLATTPCGRSKFVPPLFYDKIYGHYWRDLPTREGLCTRFDAYVAPLSLNIDEECYAVALARVTSEIDKVIPRQSLKPHSFTGAWASLKLDKSSGFPDYVKKGTLREKTFREFAQDCRFYEKTHDIPVYPCTVAARLAIRSRSERNRPRLVWSYPIRQMTKEACFAPQLYEAFKTWKLIGWIFRWLDDGKGFHAFRSWLKSGRIHNGNDFSQFDARVIARLIRDLFAILKERFVMTQVQSNMWRDIVEYFIHTPILLFDAVRQKHRGLPSGSFFTQLIGCLANLFANYYACQKAGILRHLRDIIVLGDDSISAISAECWYPSVRNSFEAAFSDLGMVLNVDKAYVSACKPGVGKFLGMEITDSGPPRFLVDTFEVRKRLVLPESRDKCPMDCYARILGLCWSYGYDRKAYKLLHYAYRWLVDKYPDLLHQDVETHDPEMSRYFRYVLHESVPLRFPTHEEVKYRYYGYI